MNSYISFTLGFCAGAPKGRFHRADSLEGPWSDATEFDLSSAGATKDSYQGVLHPEVIIST